MSAEQYIKQIRHANGIAVTEEKADIVGRLVRIGAYPIAKAFIDFIANTEPANNSWRCEHRHSAKSHPKCHAKYLKEKKHD